MKKEDAFQVSKELLNTHEDFFSKENVKKL